MRSVLFVCPSVCHSVCDCEQDSSRSRLLMSIKHCRHRQGVTFYKGLNFAVDPDPA